MKVSVIITVYNLENFVTKAIESVLNQSIVPHEIIVVDDGSRDKSVEKIQSFGDKVMLIKMGSNSGVLPAFIEGIKKSSGDILCFLDGDDMWVPDKIEKVLQVFNSHSNVMLITHLHQWINDKDQSLNVYDSTHKNIDRIVNTTADEKDRDRLLKNSILCYKGVWLGSAFCIRRNALNIEEFEKWVYSLPGKELSHQDQPLAAFLIYHNPEKDIHLINEKLFLYRVYPSNSSGASMNIEAALRTIERSIATVSRTRDIVLKNSKWSEEGDRQNFKLKELTYLKSLYANKRLNAIKLFFSLLPKWNSQEKLKETKRLIGCNILGPSKFLSLKTKSRFS